MAYFEGTRRNKELLAQLRPASEILAAKRRARGLHLRSHRWQPPAHDRKAGPAITDSNKGFWLSALRHLFAGALPTRAKAANDGKSEAA